MKAIKCDRCGKFYETNSWYDDGKEGNYKVDIYEKCLRGSRLYEHNLDLCDDCQKALREFMKGGKQ